MNIARILYPVRVLGPGRRVGIWTCGCKHHCADCSNPELWETRPEFEITIPELIRAIEKSLQGAPVDGFVITGGDPFYQPEELAELLSELKRLSDDVLVYTGFSYDELRESAAPTIRTCLAQISVLIDGPYIDKLNDGSLLRGSSNQRIIYLDSVIKAKYETYLAELGVNRIQNFTVDDGIISVGIHERNFAADIFRAAKGKGVVVDGG